MSRPKPIVLYEGDPEQLHLVAMYVVCHRCHGNGSHVNPAVDGNGLSPDDPDLDEDFWDMYRSGGYDVPCEECNGLRVVPVPDPDMNSAEAMQNYEEFLASGFEYQQMCEAERRFGC